MTLQFASLFQSGNVGLLRLASLMVPWQQRGEWWSEWRSELWHVRSAYLRIDETISLQSQGEITWFCLGAFADALCVRELAGRSAGIAAGPLAPTVYSVARTCSVVIGCMLPSESTRFACVPCGKSTVLLR